jgi:hypothetical protein
MLLASAMLASRARAADKEPAPPARFDEGALIAPAFDKTDKTDKTERPVEPVAAPPALPPPAPPPPAEPAPAPVAPVLPSPSEQAAPLLEQVDELATLEAAESLAKAARPRFSMSVAMGISVDNAGVADHRNVMIPSFAVMGGIGQKRLGFEARLFASEAAGRYSTPNAAMGGKPVADVGADRQAVDLLLAVRPLAGWNLEDVRWGARVARALTANAGLGGERVSVAASTVFRLGAVIGAHADFPVTPAESSNDLRSELNVRLSVRRMFGTGGTAGTGAQAESIGDTKLEALAGLAFVF